MTKRRDSCTAVLFLLGIFSAAIFLAVGWFTQVKGFDEPVRPASHTFLVRTKDNLRAQPAKRKVALAKRQRWEAAPASRKRQRKTDPASLTRPAPLPLRTSLGTPLPSYDEAAQALAQGAEGVEPALNGLLDRDHGFIQLYGGVQSLLGRRMVEDADPQYTVVKLTDGLLTFLDPTQTQEDMTLRAREMVSFAQRVRKEYKVPLLYVQAPSKLSVVQAPEGLTDYSDAEADQFLALLEKEKVDTLDLRPVFREAVEEKPELARELFFTTDHHWTPAGAFLGYQTLCEKLEKRYRFSFDEALTDPDSFDKFDFQDSFLGSQGRRVGSAYAGLDSLAIWSPKFPTDFTYSVPVVNVQREGPFVVSLLFPERLADTDLYTTNPYTIYSGGDYLLTRAVNEELPRGKRVLVLRDSFGCAITPFLSLGCQEVMTIDPRHFNGNQDTMMDYIDWLEPDLVIVLNTTGSLRVDKLFPYLPSARAAALAAKDQGEE